MSAAAELVSTVKLLAAPSAEIAFAAVVLTGFAVPAVPVNTSTFPLSAAAGATPMAALASSAPANASGFRNLCDTGGAALPQGFILLPPPPPLSLEPAGQPPIEQKQNYLVLRGDANPPLKQGQQPFY